MVHTRRSGTGWRASLRPSHASHRWTTIVSMAAAAALLIVEGRVHITTLPSPPLDHAAAAPRQHAGHAAKISTPVPLQLGNYTMKISTPSTAAQSFFNIGIMHEFGFNQAEARQAMDNAVDADPTTCPMCYWGVAYVNGPFINHPTMSTTQAEVTYNAIRKAASLCNASLGQDGP